MKIFDSRLEYLKASSKNGELICCDCSRPYKYIIDLIIDDILWEKITPTAKFDRGAGILCPSCTLNRLAELGLHPEPYSLKFKKGARKINGKYEWEVEEND